MQADPPKRKRRWFQFSLRTLMIFVLIVAFPCAWLGRKIDRKRKERDAVTAIAKMGGRVFFDFQRDATIAPPPGALGPSASTGPWRTKAEPFGPVWLRNLLGNDFFSEVDAVWLNSATVTDEDLVNLRGLLWLQDLSLAGTKVTDAGLANLKPLTRLRSLNLNQTAISDAGLVHLSAMSRLEQLHLHGTNVGDAGIAHLSGLTELKVLSLAETKVTDAGMAQLRGLSQLELLILGLTDVSDAGLPNLEGLANLRDLELQQTKTSRAGANNLQKALPNCKIAQSRRAEVTPAYGP